MSRKTNSIMYSRCIGVLNQVFSVRSFPINIGAFPNIASRITVRNEMLTISHIYESYLTPSDRKILCCDNATQIVIAKIIIEKV